jgi:hypothetical protein
VVEPPFTPEKNHHSQDLDPHYGSETGLLTKREENQLFVFERKVLQTICCPKIENGVYRKRYNHKLDEEVNLSQRQEDCVTLVT